jgi:chromosome segregation ATPase
MPQLDTTAALGSCVSVIGGFVTTWFFTKYGKRITQHIRRKDPDRIESIFNGYDRFIEQLNKENNRKDKLIDQLEGHIEGLEDNIARLKEDIGNLRGQLTNSNKQCQRLQIELKGFKKEYRESPGIA